MTVHEIENEMSPNEFYNHLAYLRFKREEEEKAQKKANRKSR